MVSINAPLLTSKFPSWSRPHMHALAAAKSFLAPEWNTLMPHLCIGFNQIWPPPAWPISHRREAIVLFEAGGESTKHMLGDA
jgi:hypothetical protein